MKINVKLNLNKDFASQIKSAENKALERTVQAILDDVKARGVVPKDTGELERSGFADLHGATIDDVVAHIVFDTR